MLCLLWTSTKSNTESSSRPWEIWDLPSSPTTTLLCRKLPTARTKAKRARTKKGVGRDKRQKKKKRMMGSLLYNTHACAQTHTNGEHLCVAYHLRPFDSRCALICAVPSLGFEVKIPVTFHSLPLIHSLPAHKQNHKWPPPVIFVIVDADSPLNPRSPPLPFRYSIPFYCATGGLCA